jgi:hypothetical protein
MTNQIECKSSEKSEWFKQHNLAEQQVRQLIAEKLERARNQQALKGSKKL